jgi:hypothetical protein
LSIQSKIEGNTICPLGDAAANSSSIRHLEKNLNTTSACRSEITRTLEKQSI